MTLKDKLAKLFNDLDDSTWGANKTQPDNSRGIPNRTHLMYKADIKRIKKQIKNKMIETFEPIEQKIKAVQIATGNEALIYQQVNILNEWFRDYHFQAETDRSLNISRITFKHKAQKGCYYKVLCPPGGYIIIPKDCDFYGMSQKLFEEKYKPTQRR